MSNKTRLQFDFANEALTRLDELVEDLGLSTRAEGVRLGLALLDVITVLYKQEGYLTAHRPGAEPVTLLWREGQLLSPMRQLEKMLSPKSTEDDEA